MKYKIQYHYQNDIHSFEFQADGFDNDGTYIRFYKYVGPFTGNGGMGKEYKFLWNNKEVHSVSLMEII